MLRRMVITGANKGIGLAIADNFAGKFGWEIVLACRNKQRAEDACQKLLGKHKNAKVEVELLDVSSQESIELFTDRISQTRREIDVLVNNAGVYIKGDNNGQIVSDTLATVSANLTKNFYGTVQLTESLLPRMRKYGKIITLGSSLGKYKTFTDDELRERFRNANQKELWGLLEQFLKEAEDGKFSYNYPSAYIMSKMAINIYTTRLLPQHPLVLWKELQVYGQCPGYVATDMTDFKGFLSVEQGASTTVYLAELPFQIDPAFQGRFFERCKPSSL